MLWSCSPKILQGTYTSETESEIQSQETTIVVLPKKKVKVTHKTGQGEFYGEGTYQINGNDLVITFNEVEGSSGEYEMYNLEVNYVDAFMYKVFAQASQNLFGATVYVIDKQGYLVKRNTIKENGISNLEVPKNAIIDHISISASGYYPLKIPITEPGSKKIEIYLEEDVRKYIPKGTQEVYKIDKTGEIISLTRDEIKCTLISSPG
jgi:hypothetical protein